MKIFSLIAVLMCLSSVAGFLGKNVKVRGMELRAGEFPTPRAPKLNLVRGLLQGGAALVTGLVVTQNMPQARAQGRYNIVKLRLTHDLNRFHSPLTDISPNISQYNMNRQVPNSSWRQHDGHKVPRHQRLPGAGKF